MLEKIHLRSVFFMLNIRCLLHVTMFVGRIDSLVLQVPGGFFPYSNTEFF